LDYRADLRNLKTTKKFKMPQLTEEGADQAAAAGRKKKKKKKQHNHLARLQQSFGLNSNTRTGC
jgi:hypothetical protein